MRYIKLVAQTTALLVEGTGVVTGPNRRSPFEHFTIDCARHMRSLIYLCALAMVEQVSEVPSFKNSLPQDIHRKPQQHRLVQKAFTCSSKYQAMAKYHDGRMSLSLCSSLCVSLLYSMIFSQVQCRSPLEQGHGCALCVTKPAYRFHSRTSRVFCTSETTTSRACIVTQQQLSYLNRYSTFLSRPVYSQHFKEQKLHAQPVTRYINSQSTD